MAKKARLCNIETGGLFYKFYFIVSYNVFTVSYYHPCLIFDDKTAAYQSGVPSKGRLLKFPANIKLSGSDEHSSLLQNGIDYRRKMLYITSPGFNHKNLFCRKFTNSFCKLDLFITKQQILLIFMKWSSFKKSVSKHKPKRFYKINPRLMEKEEGHIC